MNRFLLIILALGFSTVATANEKKPPAPKPSPAAQDCRARHDAHEYEAAFAACTRAAQSGDLESKYLLGRLYEKGTGVTRDLDAALKLYRSAADKGHPASQHRVAAAYAFGIGGVKKDEAEAVKWLKRAAEGGHPRAQAQLAEGYRRGAGGLPKDEKLAREWSERAERGKGN